MVSLLALPDVKEGLPALGFEIVASTPGEFATRIKVEIESRGKVIRAANIKRRLRPLLPARMLHNWRSANLGPTGRSQLPTSPIT
jgi:hypothetical protein